MRIVQTAIVALALVGSAPAAAACFPNCVSLAPHKPSSIIPDPDNSINRFGDLFSNDYDLLQLGDDGSTEVKIGFGVLIGQQLFNSVFVSENGALSFGAPLSVGQQGSQSSLADAQASGGFIPITSLKDFGKLPVIAPFYADLVEGQRSEGDGPQLGQIVVQYGMADPTPDAKGNYSVDELLPATRITWYGLNVASGAGGPQTTLAARGDQFAFAQILFTDQGKGDFNIEFRTGDPADGPPYSQPGYGSLAGFNLPGGGFVEFTGPYDDGTPSYFAFRGGVFQSVVPEAATWLMMIAGFGFAGGGVRMRRRAFVLAGACRGR